MLYINRVACHDPFCLFGFNLDSCTVFRQSTVAEASLLLFNDLSRIENDLEMMVPRFFSAGCRIKSLYRSTSAVFLQLFPFPPTSHNAHSRKRKVAGTTGDNIQKRSPNNSGNRLETAARFLPDGKLLQTVNSGTEADLSFRARGSAIHPD